MAVWQSIAVDENEGIELKRPPIALRWAMWSGINEMRMCEDTVTDQGPDRIVNNIGGGAGRPVS